MDSATPVASYLARTGRSKYWLSKSSGLPWKTIHRLARGLHAPGHRVASAIERATGGEVTAAELLGLSATPVHASSDVNPEAAE